MHVFKEDSVQKYIVGRVLNGFLSVLVDSDRSSEADGCLEDASTYPIES